MDLGLTNKVTVITGAGRGIGKATALALAKEGSKVVCLTQSKEHLNLVLNELNEIKTDCRGYVVDVRNTQRLQDIFKEIYDTYSKIDVLINNAGITNAPTLVMKTHEDTWDNIMDVNLKACYMMCKIGVPYLLRNRSGSIINVASVLGQIGAPGLTVYSASKSGVIGLTKSLAKEVAKKNITCNAVAPGYILTDINKQMPSHVKERLLSNIVMGSPGVPDDVAALILFLASEKATYITGQVYNVDGGLVI